MMPRCESAASDTAPEPEHADLEPVGSYGTRPDRRLGRGDLACSRPITVQALTMNCCKDSPTTARSVMRRSTSPLLGRLTAAGRVEHQPGQGFGHRRRRTVSPEHTPLEAAIIQALTPGNGRTNLVRSEDELITRLVADGAEFDHAEQFAAWAKLIKKGRVERRPGLGMWLSSVPMLFVVNPTNSSCLLGGSPALERQLDRLREVPGSNHV